MLILRRRAYARAGLMGNPSDGYHGKTISFIVRDFFAEVTLYEWPDLEVVTTHQDQSRFRSIDELAKDVELHGYYGGIRLVKATIKKFAEYCRRTGQKLHDQNFSIRYESNIPRQVGLAGSSAIIVATLRCLTEFYLVDIPRHVQPSLVLSVETEELGISAGLQDRVVQVYEGLVYMDFTRERMQTQHRLAYGVYEPLDPARLPPVYIAYCGDISEPTEVLHNNLRARYSQGEQAVVDAMGRFAELTDRGKEAIAAGDFNTLHTLINQNFDLRQSICRIPAAHLEMVLRARSTGASAKFAGSGGAIVGTYTDDEMYGRLQHELATIGCTVIRPQILV